MGTVRIPIVLDDYGEQQQLQPGEELTVQDEIDYQRKLIRKLIFILTSNGFPINDPQLINELEYL